jgi:hypothetical protein
VNPAALSVTPRSQVPRALEARAGRRGWSSPEVGDDQQRRQLDRTGDAEPLEVDDGDRPQGSPPRRRLPLRRLTRRHLTFVAGGVVAGWVALVIAGAVGDSSAVNQRAADLRVENAALQARLDSIRREEQLVQSEAYVSLEARAYGMGRGNERAFTLQPGAPPPPRLKLLGEDPSEGKASSPLDDWLTLLFGS